MLAPLLIDGNLTASPPIRVGERAVPIGPQIDGRARRVVSDPDDLLMSGKGERNPRAVDIILPEQVIRDDPPGRMKDSDDALQWEPFVALNVQEWRECPRELLPAAAGSSTPGTVTGRGGI